LSADCFVKIWDTTNFDVVSSVFLPDSRELVCMACDPTHNLFMVGSQTHVHFIDPRVPHLVVGEEPQAAQVVGRINSNDSDWGIRSLVVEEDVLSVGGGMGRLSFYDLRKGRYLTFHDTSRPFLEVGKTKKQQRKKTNLFHLFVCLTVSLFVFLIAL
jgi:WD repeat-containing protein 40A